MIWHLLLVVFALLADNGAALAQQDVRLQTSDGVPVHGDFFAPQRRRGIILLFHQARSSCSMPDAAAKVKCPVFIASSPDPGAAGYWTAVNAFLASIKKPAA
jgi:hypothetical protein